MKAEGDCVDVETGIVCGHGFGIAADLVQFAFGVQDVFVDGVCFVDLQYVGIDVIHGNGRSGPGFFADVEGDIVGAARYIEKLYIWVKCDLVDEGGFLGLVDAEAY